MQEGQSVKKIKWGKILGEKYLEELSAHFSDVQLYLGDYEYESSVKEEHIYSVMEKERYNLPEELEKYIKNILGEMDDSFLDFFIPFLFFGCEELEKKIGYLNGYTHNIYKGFINSLLSEMSEICTRAIICELGKKKAPSLVLFGQTWKVFRKEFFETYPSAARLISECISRKVGVYEEMLSRYNKDRELIARGIFGGKEPGVVDQIEINLSDAHCSGRQVIKIITVNKMSLFYKPHSLENDKWFYGFAQFLGEKCNIHIYKPRMVSFTEHGWTEVIPYQPCKTKQEAEKYFERIGLYLFIAYLLGTQDIHCENLIAMGEYPVIIDLECLTSCQPKAHMKEMNFMQERLASSVIASGILPYCHWRKGDKVVDLSALSGGDNSVAPFKIPTINRNEDGKISVIYKEPNVTPKSNRLLLYGDFASPARFENMIQCGFAKAYMQAAGHIEEIDRRICTLSNLTSRYLAAHTQKYYMILQSSYHPEVMQEEYGRNLFLYSLWKSRMSDSTFGKEIAKAEMRDLLVHSIPYFYFYMGKTDLYDSAGNIIPDFFFKDAVSGIRSRLQGLSQQDLDLQKRLIHISLHGGGAEDPAQNQILTGLREMVRTPSKFTKDELLNAVESIGMKLLDEAVYSWDGREMGWLDYEVMQKEKGTVRMVPCNMYLYNGIAGILLFFFFLSRYTEPAEFSEAYRKLERQLFNYTDEMLGVSQAGKPSNSGLYNGEASIVYTYLILYWEDKDDRYLDYAVKHSKLLDAAAQRDSKFDLLEGRAGALFAFCCLFQTKPEEEFLQNAQHIAEGIMKGGIKAGKGTGWEQGQDMPPLLGMSHGNSGIMLPLLKYYTLSGEKRYYECFKEAFVYERENYNPDLKDWNDYRSEGVNRNSPASWCHGSGGILLAYMLICDMETDACRKQEFMGEISKAYAYADSHKSRIELCLCHGECGNNLIITEYKKRIGARIRQMKPYEDCGSMVLTKEWFNYGMMNGITGVGYYLLLQCGEFKDYILLLKE